MDIWASFVRGIYWFASETIKTVALGLFLFMLAMVDRGLPWPLAVLATVGCLVLAYVGQRQRTKYLKWVHAGDPAGNK